MSERDADRVRERGAYNEPLLNPLIAHLLEAIAIEKPQQIAAPRLASTFPRFSSTFGEKKNQGNCLNTNSMSNE